MAIVTTVSLLTTVSVLCVSFVGSSTVLHAIQGPYITHTVVEGKSVFLTCNDTAPGDRVYWSHFDGTVVAEGKLLSFVNTTRNYTGIYLCKEDIKATIVTKETVFIDVLYPEKIFSLEVLSKDVLVNESYIITLKVEGNPVPTTTISQNGHVLFQANETGVFNASITHVTCTEFGSIELSCSNMLSNETRTEVMLVHCPPGPKGGVDTKYRPRLGENVTLHIDSIGYPYPTYTWSFNGTVLKNETVGNENEYEVNKVNVEDFGVYTLLMSNPLGTSNVEYMLEAYGPPDPVTKLGVNNVTVNTANITFVSGYDYGATANFIVQSFNGQAYEDITSFEDKNKAHRPANVSHVIENLSFGTVYNLTIVANNSRGLGQRSPAFILFTTKIPYSTYDVIEGTNFTLSCNASANMTDVHWENIAGQRKSEGSELDVVDINRNYSGFYECVGKSGTSSKTTLANILINVQYPAKILTMRVSENYIKPNDTYFIELKVEGNPPPNITFIKLRDGSAVFAMNETGTFNITIDPVGCTDQGQYQLKCINEIGSEMKDEDIYVYCPPVVDPKAHITKQFYPRLGNMTMVQIENYGYPYPNYTWKHDKTSLPHKDTNISSLITVNVTVDDFGEYSVVMDNEYGDVEVSFQFIPKGPPDPVTKLGVNNVTVNTANITFVSGYDYGATANFIVQSFNGQAYEDITSFEDKKKAHRPANVSHVIQNLSFGTVYNLTIVANNSRGLGQRSPAFVLFTTKVPYSTYDVIEGTNFTLSCNASANMTDVHWENIAGQRKSEGSELDVVDINRNYSGFYECVGKSGTLSKTTLANILINVQYPAKILKMSASENYIKPNDTYYIELEVEGNPPPNITFTKLRDGSEVFAMNETGTFNITINPVGCTDQGQYQLKCINQIGSEMRDEDIYVYCPPVVDPKAHITKQFYPRLGNMTLVRIENYGYPYPNYTWKHDKTTLPHKDTNISSVITVNVTVGDFGEYSVDMDNEYGDVEVSFQFIPKGAPEAVSGLQLANSTFNSVALNWQAGYNYGSNQTFMVMSTDGNSLQNFTDETTQWHENRTYTVTGLNSSTPYTLTVVSRNEDGNSDPPQGSGTVQFTTAAAPLPHNGSTTHKAAIIGGVLGGVCILVILVVVAIFLKRRRNRPNQYENIEEDHHVR